MSWYRLHVLLKLKACRRARQFLCTEFASSVRKALLTLKVKREEQKYLNGTEHPTLAELKRVAGPRTTLVSAHIRVVAEHQAFLSIRAQLKKYPAQKPCLCGNGLLFYNCQHHSMTNRDDAARSIMKALKAKHGGR